MNKLKEAGIIARDGPNYQPREDMVAQNNSWCKLCSLVLNSQVQAEQHYKGKAHYNQCLKLGVVLPNRPVKSKGKSETPTEGTAESETKRKSTTTCEICNIVFNSDAQAASHFYGNKHNKRASLTIEQNAWKPILYGEEEPETAENKRHYCEPCNLLLNSEGQLETHLQGQQHRVNVGEKVAKKSTAAATRSAKKPAKKSGYNDSKHWSANKRYSNYNDGSKSSFGSSYGDIFNKGWTGGSLLKPSYMDDSNTRWSGSMSNNGLDAANSGYNQSYEVQSSNWYPSSGNGFDNTTPLKPVDNWDGGNRWDSGASRAAVDLDQHHMNQGGSPIEVVPTWSPAQRNVQYYGSPSTTMYPSMDFGYSDYRVMQR